jgi:hypothetical protein
MKVGEGKSYSTILLPRHTLGTIQITQDLISGEEE